MVCGLGMAVPSDHDIVHALPDDLPVGLWVARAPGGELVYANEMFAEIMGMTARQDVAAGGYSGPYGIYTRDGKLYPEELLPFPRALTEQRVVVVDDISIHRRDGTRIDVRAFARPVAADGAITHVVIAFFDVTREVEAERRLAAAQRMEALGTLAGGIAHDFNNLIFGIKLIAAELSATETDPARKASLELIDEVTERSSTLTRSLLGFARRGKHRSAPIKLADLVRDMGTMLRRTMPGIDFGFEPLASGVAVGDASQLEQVVMNLVVNARDANASRIVVRVTDVVLDDAPAGAIGAPLGGPALVLEVSDDGTGIPADVRDRVFEPYFTTKHDDGRGTGLGLATVLGIVESHGGAIEHHVGLDGRGTTFRIYLPVAAAAVETPRREAQVGAPVGHGTILIVDDDAMERRALALALSSFGYTPVEAASGGEGVERLRAGGVRAVVLDVVMPQLSGRDTLAAMLAIDPRVVVILMSASTLDEDVQDLLALGARGFVPKPYSAERLAQVLGEVLVTGGSAGPS